MRPLVSTDGEAGPARLFVAIELPDDWRGALTKLQRQQERMSPGAFRWVTPDALHCTLIFMGSKSRGQLGALGAAVARAAAAVPPFRLSLGGVGVFGPPRAPRVLWIKALQPDGCLQRLRHTLEQELRALEVPFDGKPLRPHVTLGRARRGGPTLEGLVSARLDAAPRRVERVVLFESILRPGGPRYVPLITAALGGSP